jgi:hypothetical protein
MDLLKNLQFYEININTHLRILTDPNIFAKNEILKNDRLVKQFLQALEIKV